MENRVTEQTSAYDNLQDMSVRDILTGINREDSLVPGAVAKVIPTMEQLVERIVERMRNGGRMVLHRRRDERPAGRDRRLGAAPASNGVPFDLVTA